MARLLEFELGTTVANRKNLRLYGVSDPDSFPFTPYSQTRVRGDGRSIGFGFPTVTWSWNFLAQAQLAEILELFSSDLDASVVVHIRTYKSTGKGHPERLTAYQAIMHRPLEGEGKTAINETRLPSYSDVSIRFTRLEEE